MDRRTAIRNLALVMGSAALLPHCSTGSPVAHFKHFDVSADDESMLAEMTETIIPRTTTPGAKDLKLDSFVWLMVDDCKKKSDQQAFLRGMAEFRALVQKTYGKTFQACTAQQRESLLTALDKDHNRSRDLHSFFATVKGLTVFGYTESQYFMTKEVVYELVPGRYNAYFPVKNNLKVKVNG